MYKLFIGIIFVIISLIFSGVPVLATSTPLLVNPTNNSTINASPTFNWQIVPEAIQYRIIVDDESTFTSPYIKNYYTTNNFYSPTITPGTYFWKVEAKDINNVWSSWSDIWTFTFDDSQTTPTPTPTETPSPTPTETPSPTPTESPTPTPTPEETPTPTEEPTPTPTQEPILEITPTPIQSGPTTTPSTTPTISITPKQEHEDEHKSHWSCQIKHHEFKSRFFRFQIPYMTCHHQKDSEHKNHEKHEDDD